MKMKPPKKIKPTKGSKTPPVEDDDDIEPDEQEKMFYTILWGTNWDDDYPPKNKKKG